MPEVQQLLIQDPRLSDLFETPEKIEYELATDYFQSLLSAIISQQLSGKVAKVIFDRVALFFKNELTPERIFSADTEALRECGLSYRKIEYIKSLADKVMTNQVYFKDIEKRTNHEIIEMLTKIKGIGPWTAEMFLIFSLGRKDVFSVLDLGLRNGLSKLYQETLTPEVMVEHSLKWSPFQTYVSLYLWRYNERK